MIYMCYRLRNWWQQQLQLHSLSDSHSRFLLSCKCGHSSGLLLSIIGLARCKAVTSFRFSFSRVFLSVNGFRNGTGAFDLTMPSGRTGFFGILPASATSVFEYKSVVTKGQPGGHYGFP